MNLLERLELFETTGQISTHNCRLMKKIVENLHNKWKVSLNDECAATLITHLALAWERVGRNELAKPLDDMLYQEVRGSTFVDCGQQILKEWEKILGHEFPEAEKGYLLLHTCTLLEKMGDEK